QPGAGRRRRDRHQALAEAARPRRLTRASGPHRSCRRLVILRPMPATERRAPVPADQLRIGLVLPTWTITDLRWEQVLEIAASAAEVGFDSLYATDHLLLPSTNEELRRRAGAEVPEGAVAEPEGYLEAFTLIAAVAVAIPKLQVGPLVACTGYRNPGLLAKMATTLDDISGGRLVLGLGAGDSEGEHLTFGFPHEQRVGRFEETLQITKSLFNEISTDFDGAHHRLRGVHLLPGVRRQGGPPILIGTINPRARMRRLVAQYADIWNGWLGYTDARPESAATQLRIIDDACREHGRDPNTLVATTAVRGAMPGSGYTPRP